MKKVLAFIIISLCFALCGCENNTTVSNNLENETNEETTQDVSETETANIVKDKTYSLDDDDSIRFVMEDDDSISIYCTISNTEKASLAFTYFYSLLSSEEAKQYTSYLTVKCDKASAMYSKGTVFGTNSDGTATMNSLPNWIITDTGKYTISSQEMADYVSKLNEFGKDFTK